MTVKKYINGRREDVDYIDAAQMKAAEVKQYIARRHGSGKYILYEYSQKLKRPITNTVIIDDLFLTAQNIQPQQAAAIQYQPPMPVSSHIEETINLILEKLIDLETILIEEEKEEEKDEIGELLNKIPAPLREKVMSALMGDLNLK